MTGGTRFDSTTRTDGNGGTITVTTTDGISISGERPFRIVSDNFGLGNSRASGIYSQTVGNELCSGTCGNAGGILVTTGDFQLAQGGAINVGTSSTGHGGAATVVATNGISISGAMLDGTPSGIFSRTVGTVLESGEGGNIALTAGQSVTISDGASVSASSTGPGNTGNIEINAGNQFAMTNSSVTTEANLASGGTIKITTTPSGTVQLTNSTISASVLDGTGGGGSVNIDPQFVILQNSQILATATQGPGGNIFITTNLLLPDANSVISASSQFGVNGTVTIQSPNAPASGKIQPLGKTPLLATSLLNQRCAALANGEFSSFTVAGRDSLPTEPGSWLTSPLATLSGGTGLGAKAEGVKAEGERPDIPILSLRQIAPAGFLTQAFAVDWSAGCQS
jgi:large exoprotein involved in heme utilization and adhesion